MVQALQVAQEQGEAGAQEPARQLLAATQELQEVSRVGAVRVGEAAKVLLPALDRAAKAVEGAVALKQRARDEQAEHQLDLDKEVAEAARGVAPPALLAGRCPLLGGRTRGHRSQTR